MAAAKRGVVLKKRGMPLVPWSERTLDVSGAVLVYEYPMHNLSRTYQLGSSWRCWPGSGDTFKLLAIDAHGRREEMTLRPLSRSKAERDEWVRVIAAGIREAVEASLRRRTAAARAAAAAEEAAVKGDQFEAVLPRVAQYIPELGPR